MFSGHVGYISFRVGKGDVYWASMRCVSCVSVSLVICARDYYNGREDGLLFFQ